VSLIPFGFEGDRVDALVIGGGRVGTRRALTLLDAGARVRVIAPAISAELDEAARRSDKLTVERRDYRGAEDIGDAMLIVAATATPTVNERVACDARQAKRAVNVADASENGDFVFLAAHRAGPVTIGVSAGSVPNAAGRIRDSIAERIDGRYAKAITDCAQIRAQVLAASGSGEWQRVAADLIDERFCESIEQGTFAERAARWL
jgi:precorrin-2 dehydrogenase/sirohydrochlorin ferrochelatase